MAKVMTETAVDPLAAEKALVVAERAAREDREVEAIAANRVAARTWKESGPARWREQLRGEGMVFPDEVWAGVPLPAANQWGQPFHVSGKWWRLDEQGVHRRNVDGEWHWVCSPLVAVRWNNLGTKTKPSQIVPMTSEQYSAMELVVAATGVVRGWKEFRLAEGLDEHAADHLVRAGVRVNDEACPTGKHNGKVNDAMPSASLMVNFLSALADQAPR